MNISGIVNFMMNNNSYEDNPPFHVVGFYLLDYTTVIWT